MKLQIQEDPLYSFDLGLRLNLKETLRRRVRTLDIVWYLVTPRCISLMPDSNNHKVNVKCGPFIGWKHRLERVLRPMTGLAIV